MPKQQALSDQIRAAVDASGLSRYAIWQATGLDQGALSRFMARKTGMGLGSLDRLAAFLGLRVVASKRKGGKQ